jgi:LAO/AO transport system kinase
MSEAAGQVEAQRLLDAARAGDRRALARLLSLVERDGREAEEVVELARGLAAGTHRIGITGAPGAGKSTLGAALAAELRRRGRRVAIVAVDPTSPQTGGALLGDRVRMSALHADPGVFVRSLASRNAVGGFAAATDASAAILGAAGYASVLIETVGAGQAELDVAAEADTTLLVVAPGLGDAIQALKAGIVEVADVIAVNKADLDGADQLVDDLTFGRGSDARAEDGVWSVPIVKTIATRGEGLPELADALIAHQVHAPTSAGPRALRLAETLVLRAAARRAQQVVERRARAGGRLAALAGDVAARRLTAEEAARRLVDEHLRTHDAAAVPVRGGKA